MSSVVRLRRHDPARRTDPVPEPQAKNQFPLDELAVGGRLEFRGARPARHGEVWRIDGVQRGCRWHHKPGMAPAAGQDLVWLRSERSGGFHAVTAVHLCRDAAWYLLS